MTLHWIKAGSGEALDFLKARQVDVVLVHAPAAEAAAVKAGWAVNPTLIGSNVIWSVSEDDVEHQHLDMRPDGGARQPGQRN